MSDEEKKAIVELNHFSNMTAYWKQEEYTNSEIDNYIKLVLNLIEKQQKEIEEAEQKEKKAYIDGTNVAHELCNKYWQDKIKAKMKEKEWSLENYDCNESDYKQSQAIGAWSVLQSLLDKE